MATENIANMGKARFIAMMTGTAHKRASFSDKPRRQGQSRVRLVFLYIASGFAFSEGATAHPGGLNAEGCHTNRKTGEYHCHRPGRATSPFANRPVQRATSASSYFPNCASARAAGAAPLRRGDPGYRAGLDRDDDGIACE
ncbi:excalibur calcium-binding domain-containing protein [Novosphingobium percolationis]|uniref:excalibur calcium-binding domain-containing protein n=1 Tax=Novosphingobium percolationis TaxID=2871811 RepID=UPI001CD3744B|nr:excalibur calcium-binding domain-containing protein [Novosphingobium percolationis]